MEPKVELYTAICTAMDRPDSKTAIWEILSGYTVTATAACSSLEDSIEEFLAAKRADSLSEKSIRNYRQILNLFRQWLDLPPAQITTDHVRRWLSHLKEERHMKKDSVQTYLNCLRSFFGWLQTEEKIQRNPMNRIRSARIDKKHTRQPLTQEEVERCRAVLETPRERAIFELYLSTGCRLSELVNVPTSSVDFQSRTIEVCGKGDKIRTVYFSVRAKLALQSYLAHRKNSSDLLSCNTAPYGPLGSRAPHGGRGLKFLV